MAPFSSGDWAWGLVQVLSLTTVYAYLLYTATNMLSEGSELLLLVPSMAGIVGSVVLPILAAVPDGAILGGAATVAQMAVCPGGSTADGRAKGGAYAQAGSCSPSPQAGAILSGLGPDVQTRLPVGLGALAVTVMPHRRRRPTLTLAWSWPWPWPWPGLAPQALPTDH